MFSNYPPGVTGNEWQIAGLEIPEPEVLTCSSSELTQCVPTSGLVGWLMDIEKVDSLGEAKELVGMLHQWVDTHSTAVREYDCDWEGEVEDFDFDGGGGWTWTCPICGTINDLEEALSKKYTLDRNEFGLTANEVAVLFQLETPSYSEIAERLGTSKQRVGQIVSGLKTKEMVEKVGNRIVASDRARKVLDAERRREKSEES